VFLMDTTICPYVAGTGTEEALPTSSNLYLYPNPTNGNAFLQLPNDGAKHQITLYNELGQLVNMLRATTEPTVELPTSGLAAGIYVVHVITENGNSQHIRLVKTD
ncbi:MAG: T9SS type A sorting domain-containing protein, partial [Bacteroidia bacterium]